MTTRTLALATLVVMTLSHSTAFAQSVTSFDDIDYWVGSGSNNAALAIDWDGLSSTDEALVWGYRWDGASLGIDLVRDIVTADERLYLKLNQVAGLGLALVGIGYDQNNDSQLELSDGTQFDEAGIEIGPLSDGANSVDPADLYAEGWFLGYWHLGVASTSPFDAGNWSSTFVGIDDLQLVDGVWLSLAFTTNTLSISEFADNPVAAEAPLLADFDTDDDVDGFDFVTWQRGFGTSADATRAQGDANGDQRVDQIDLEHWGTEFGSFLHIDTLVAVSEPQTCCFILTAFVTYLGISRTIRRCT